jgi:hypothetical protein
MATMLNSAHKGWFFERLGKGSVISGKDGNTGEFITKYKACFEAATVDETCRMTRLAEKLIRDSGLPNELMRIKTHRVPLTHHMTFIVASHEVYDEAMSRRMFEGILAIGKSVEKDYFSAKVLRTT